MINKISNQYAEFLCLQGQRDLSVKAAREVLVCKDRNARWYHFLVSDAENKDNLIMD
jgi:23S rRNA A1618 N6-methylase RlmF